MRSCFNADTHSSTARMPSVNFFTATGTLPGHQCPLGLDDLRVLNPKFPVLVLRVSGHNFLFYSPNEDC
jgi:hypothetical protein